jgi:tripartite-type tricarboxylate transporter receptor subunit TctC
MKRLSFALLGLFFAFSALAQSYPARSVKIIVPFGVGGSADVYARFLGAKLSDALGQSFVVENRPGGGAVVGSEAVAKSPPDGYTLLMMSNTHTVNETLIPKKSYVLMKDLAPITGVNYQDLLLTIGAGVPAGNLRERRTTWRASSSRPWRAWTSCTCRTKAATRRASRCSAARSR